VPPSTAFSETVERQQVGAAVTSETWRAKTRVQDSGCNGVAMRDAVPATHRLITLLVAKRSGLPVCRPLTAPKRPASKGAASDLCGLGDRSAGALEVIWQRGKAMEGGACVVRRRNLRVPPFPAERASTCWRGWRYVRAMSGARSRCRCSRRSVT